MSQKAGGSKPSTRTIGVVMVKHANELQVLSTPPCRGSSVGRAPSVMILEVEGSIPSLGAISPCKSKNGAEPANSYPGVEVRRDCWAFGTIKTT